MKTSITNSPGPGAYELPSKIGIDSPFVSIKGKHKNIIINDIPGPG